MAANETYRNAPLRRSRTRRSDRYVSAGLATVACVGLVAAIGSRTLADNAAAADLGAQAGSASLAVDTVPTSSTGLTQDQLDAYAAQLQNEAAQLDAYRAQLVSVATSLKTAAKETTVAKKAKAAKAPKVVAQPKPVAKPAPKPVAKPAPKPAPKPQAHTTTKTS